MKIFGVDFSGAADAGRKIWIAGGERVRDGFRLESCIQAAALPGGAVERDTAIAALRAFIAAQADAAFGLDFPFSLAAADIPYATWDEFARRFADDYPTAEHLRGKNARRQTDRETKTPFSPGNLRLYRQTYYGIRSLLSPLVQADAARVVPMQTPIPGKPILMEICPASTLKALRLYVSYKGKSPAHRAQRARVLDALAALGLSLDPGLRALMIDDPEGDAVDSAIAAFTAARCTVPHPDQPPYTLEGCVYVCDAPTPTARPAH